MLAVLFWQHLWFFQQQVVKSIFACRLYWSKEVFSLGWTASVVCTYRGRLLSSRFLSEWKKVVLLALVCSIHTWDDDISRLVGTKLPLSAGVRADVHAQIEDVFRLTTQFNIIILKLGHLSENVRSRSLPRCQNYLVNMSVIIR